MLSQDELSDLIAHLTRSSRLSPDEAARIVDEVLNFLGETPEQFVRRRHRALQAAGLGNEQIFRRLACELEQWRFRAGNYSVRQIRRMIYG